MQLIQNYVDPKNKSKRPGIKMDWRTITVHNTGNAKSNATNERAFLDNPKNTAERGWHYVVHEETVIQAIPDNEVAWHAGDGFTGIGNRTSLSIEICESGKHDLSMITAAKLIARKLFEKKLDTRAVVPHKFWSDKECPRLILPIWDKFIALIEFELAKMEPIAPDKPTWTKTTALKDLVKRGLISDFDKWAAYCNNDTPLPAWVVFELFNRIFK